MVKSVADKTLVKSAKPEARMCLILKQVKKLMTGTKIEKELGLPER